ncbi:LysR family transcriptional regulator ArgP [Undibacterium sp. JH2W]|uniref:LysR family transcriptional regulator ArgP n=1 Tax=Undibacterium sp. JH2W TaxID=3413037 RepID=UPI003BF19296
MQTRLDSRQCEAFLSVIDHGSLEQAAQALNLTSSAISQRIKALEMELGNTLLIRSRPCRATTAGQKLVQHLRRVAELEQDLQSEFAGQQSAAIRIAIGVNADSLDSWLLPALAEFLIAENILLDVAIDDQDHTHDLLESGMVLGCLSAEKNAMRGCQAVPLGFMRYHPVASLAYCQRWFPQGMTREAARLAPVLTFNRKDKLQAQILLEHFGLPEHAYPTHHVPATTPYNRAILLGLGWGVIPDLMLDHLEKDKLLMIMPDHPVDVPLYWHHWKVQTPRLARLTNTLVKQARASLRQVKP